MTEHPADEILIAWCEGRVGTADAAEIRRHLEMGCDPCRERVEAMQIVLSSLKELPLEEAPEWSVKAALTRIADLESRWDAGPLRGIRLKAGRILEEVRLGVIFDSLLGMPAGIRGAMHDPEGPRQILLQSEPEGVRVRLQITPGARNLAEILGHLDAGHGGQSRAGLLQGKRTLLAKVAGDGYFRFNDVAPGEVRLRIRSGGRVFTSDPIEV